MIPFLTTCKEKCKVAFTKANLFVFINKGNHFFLSILLLVFAPAFNWFLHRLDGTSAPIDMGVYATAYAAAVVAAVLLGMATMGQRINHRPMFDELDSDIKVRETFSQLTPFQRLWLSSLNFWGYVFFFGLCLYCLSLVSAAG
jgi:hypothetical protein